MINDECFFQYVEMTWRWWVDTPIWSRYRIYLPHGFSVSNVNKPSWQQIVDQRPGCLAICQTPKTVAWTTSDSSVLLTCELNQAVKRTKVHPQNTKQDWFSPYRDKGGRKTSWKRQELKERKQTYITMY